MGNIQMAIILDQLVADLSVELEKAEDDIVFPDGELVAEFEFLFDGATRRYALPLVGLWKVVNRAERYVAWLRAGEEHRDGEGSACTHR